MTEQEKIANIEGFDAAWEHRMNGKEKPNNPYDASGQGSQWRAWQDGYDDAFLRGERLSSSW